MPRLLFALLLLVAGEAALACSCRSSPGDPAARRTLARQLARDAVALVEVELIAPPDTRRRRGEKLRVLRTLAGSAPSSFEVEWRGIPSAAACHVTFNGGGRRLVMLFPASRASGSAMRQFAVSNSCVTYLLRDAPMRAAVVDAINRRR